MDVYITKLRKHLKDDPSIEIINIHGKGYKLIALFLCVKGKPADLIHSNLLTFLALYTAQYCLYTK